MKYWLVSKCQKCLSYFTLCRKQMQPKFDHAEFGRHFESILLLGNFIFCFRPISNKAIFTAFSNSSSYVALFMQSISRQSAELKAPCDRCCTLASSYNFVQGQCLSWWICLCVRIRFSLHLDISDLFWSLWFICKSCHKNIFLRAQHGCWAGISWIWC